MSCQANGADDAELTRMSVSSAYRGGGIGKKIVDSVFDFCRQRGYMRVHLSTANPDARRFYAAKCGFVTTGTSTVPLKEGDKVVPLTVHRMVRYLGERVIRKIVIIGGTHGNERIGVELYKQWIGDCADQVKRSTFTTHLVLGNKEAVASNRRYIEADLNRQFTGTTRDTSTIEGRRAAELDQSLREVSADFIIDLHSSNSNTGLVGMISSGDYDVLALRLGRHLQNSSFPELKLTCTEGKKDNSYSIDSITTSGIAFEVGPQVHGTISFHLLESTRQLVMQTLDYIEARNRDLLKAAASASASVSTSDASPPNVLFVSSSEGNSTLNSIIETSVFHNLEIFVPRATIMYPDSGSGDRRRYCVHPDLEGPNWKEIREGDAAFIATDGSKAVVPLTIPKGGDAVAGKEGGTTVAPFYTLFVNEAAYQERDVAFALYEKKTKVVL
jgi:hypothetical protein